MDIKFHTLSSYSKITFKDRTFETHLGPLSFCTWEPQALKKTVANKKGLQLQFLLLGSKV